MHGLPEWIFWIAAYWWLILGVIIYLIIGVVFALLWHSAKAIVMWPLVLIAMFFWSP